jgi:amino acid transporter
MKNEGFEEKPSADEAQGGSQVIDGVVSLDEATQLERGLKSRHIQFLALGGA